MNNFTFHNPVKIIFGKNQIAQLSNEIPKDKKILITYGSGSIKKNNVYDQIIAALKGHTVCEFGGIEPNPKYETLIKAIPIIKENHINFILAVGGGSVIDGTKFIAAAVDFKGDPWDIVIKKAPFQTAIPFGTVLTLPAAGSEMNCNSVISRLASEDKLPFINSLVFPKFSILDPETTYTLPLHQTSNGVIDSFVHVIEQYLTYPANAPVQDHMAEGLLLTLIEEGPKALEKPNDYDVRANIMWASTMALNGLISVGLPTDWSTHRIGHQLTVCHGLDHGQTLAVLLPSVMYVKRDKKHAKLLQYAERVWNIMTGNEEQKVLQAIDKTREFFENLGVKTHLRDYNVTQSDIPKMLELLEKHEYTALGEHQDIDLKQSEKIFRQSL
jgi:NADP-dependent alcohol dehydrogenase